MVSLKHYNFYFDIEFIFKQRLTEFQIVSGCTFDFSAGATGPKGSFRRQEKKTGSFRELSPVIYKLKTKPDKELSKGMMTCET